MDLSPDAWGAPKRGMPTGSEAFLELPVALGFGPATGPTLKTALCHIRTLVGRRINIGTDSLAKRLQFHVVLVVKKILVSCKFRLKLYKQTNLKIQFPVFYSLFEFILVRGACDSLFTDLNNSISLNENFHVRQASVYLLNSLRFKQLTFPGKIKTKKFIVHKYVFLIHPDLTESLVKGWWHCSRWARMY